MQGSEKKFAKKLEYYRKQAGLSQTDLAYTVGVKPSAISNYEAGRRYPDYTIVRALEIALNIPYEDLWQAIRIDYTHAINQIALRERTRKSKSEDVDVGHMEQPLDKVEVKENRLKDRIVSDLDLFNEAGLRNISTFLSWLIEADNLKKQN